MAAHPRPCAPALIVLVLLLGGCPQRQTAAIDEPPPAVATAAPEQWGLVYDDGARIAWVPPIADAAPVTLLEYGEQRYLDAALSPDGRRLAVIAADLSVHVIELASAADAQVVGPAEGPEDRRGGLAWAPDGQRLAWLDAGDAHVVSVDGADIVVDDSGQVTEVAWSPDGAHLAVCRRDAELRDQGLVVVPADGGEPRQVAPGTGEIWAAAFPAWSPDGAVIAFEHAWEGGALCFVRADGTGLRTDLGPAFGDLTWLADGAGVLYNAAANEMETEGIAFCAPDGEPKLLFDGEFTTFDALPSGDLALLSGGDGDTMRVTVIQDAPGQSTELSARDLAFAWGDCRWQPDGEMLAVWSADTEAGAPLLVGGRTGEFTRVAEGVAGLIGWARR